jgi:hypothetical protein
MDIHKFNRLEKLPYSPLIGCETESTNGWHRFDATKIFYYKNGYVLGVIWLWAWKNKDRKFHGCIYDIETHRPIHSFKFKYLRTLMRYIKRLC